MDCIMFCAFNMEYIMFQAWLAEINEYAQEDVVIMLLGNKCDMSAERVVRTEDGERLAKVHNIILSSFITSYFLMI